MGKNLNKIKANNKTESKKLTPLMTQYYEIKNEHKEGLLLFRMGDFYELFGEDAKIASQVLNITLTQRNKKSGDDTLMCGFPHHAMEAPINRLLEAGYKVAVCDQLEDPKDAKGIVKRGVTLKLSPGVVFNPSQLKQEESYYLMAFDQKRAAFFEPSTGKAFYILLENKNDTIKLILKYEPKEIFCYTQEDKNFLPEDYQALTEVFLDAKKSPREMLLHHVKEMQGEEAVFGFTDWTEIKSAENVELNSQFFKHMEVFSSNQGDKQKSLFWTIKKTKTPGGTRLLKDFLESPLIDVEKIYKRQEGIKKWLSNFGELKKFRQILSNIGDIERRLARAGHPLGSPQDLVRLNSSLKFYLEAFANNADNTEVATLSSYLESALEEEPVSSWQSKGGYIKKGFAKNLDRLIDLSFGAQKEIQELENKEKEKTKISSLKIRFNNVFGFYIEVTKTHKDKVPDHYIRKQTLTNAERYTTEELSNLEEKVLSAKSKKINLEKEIFLEVKEKLKLHLQVLKDVAQKISFEDVYSSMAFLCIEKTFSLPTFNNEKTYTVKQGFHPVVVEDLIKSESNAFIANDFTMTKDKNFFLITGPNMAGKSTMMRQVLVISYLAQAGLPVPAKSANLPIYDAYFTRVGASDVLSEGLSTFMLEMKEASEILEKATPNSLLVLDEIGRGTSSSDGSALAQSITEYLIKKVKCHTLFASHYHELTQLNLGFQNIHMGYFEKEGDIIFTYKVKEGPSKKSYGVEVAKLAGLPQEVIDQAFKLTQQKNEVPISSNPKAEQLEFGFEPSMDLKIIEELKKINTSNMTPLQALTKLSEWQETYL